MWPAVHSELALNRFQHLTLYPIKHQRLIRGDDNSLFAEKFMECNYLKTSCDGAQETCKDATGSK